jgi:hypothetical protein
LLFDSKKRSLGLPEESVLLAEIGSYCFVEKLSIDSEKEFSAEGISRTD